jgi:ferrous iron transport protein A
MVLRFSLIFEPSSVSAPRRSLAALPLGIEAVVCGVHSERPVARRLMELGLVPGTRVQVTRVAPLGDPLELRLRNYALSIRRAEALSIEVDEPEG